MLAFSGGVDSVVLSDLLRKAGYKHDLAHCNFQLRGKEANQDTEFCEIFAKQHQQTCHVAYFQTADYAKLHKLSIQMSARELRYNWFKELIEKHNYDYVLTAHHANDNTETLLVNLIRGTGIKGLKGIPEKQQHVVRPLLFATKEDIKHYAAKHGLQYREDSSNQEVKYKRNFIRHKIIPELKKLNPSLEETLNNSIGYFKQAAEIIANFSANKFSDICHEQNNQLFINISLIKQEAQKETLLFEWLSSMGFKAQQIEQLTSALEEAKNVGKQFSSTTHQLVIDRKYIIVQKINVTNNETVYTISSPSDTKHLPISLTIEETTLPNFPSQSNEITIAYSDNLFPLTLRKWQQGDKFKPLGMSGFKKLSDFFKDQKLSLFDKENVWILTNKKHIVWVVGYRMDDRCKITPETKNILRLSVF